MDLRDDSELRGSDIARSDILRAKIYPGSDDTAAALTIGLDEVYKRIEYAYNRQGQVTAMKDPNETEHEYRYDGLGRILQDIVTAFGDNLDETVKRIQFGYDTKRLLTASVTSYDNATVGMGAVLNQVSYEYDDFGQPTAARQSHCGAVDGLSPSVVYGYEDGNRANTSRRTSMTYPDGRQLNVEYGSDGEADDQLSRMQSLRIQGEAFDLCTYTCVGAVPYGEIAYPQPGVELFYRKAAGAPVGDAGDRYNGYDRTFVTNQ